MTTYLSRLAAAFIIALLLSTFAATTSHAETEIGRLINALQKSYEEIESLKADFTQTSQMGAVGGTETSGGTVYFKKPGMMRWDYKGASNDVIVGDGATTRIYQSDLAQVLEVKAQGASVTADFLSGMGRIDRDFIVLITEESDVDYTLELVPREEVSGLKHFYITIMKSDYLVTGSTMVDMFGNKTLVAFENIEKNISIPDSTFILELPEGVKVIRPEDFNKM